MTVDPNSFAMELGDLIVNPVRNKKQTSCQQGCHIYETNTSGMNDCNLWIKATYWGKNV